MRPRSYAQSGVAGLVLIALPLLLGPARADAAPIHVSFDVEISLDPSAPGQFSPFTGVMTFFQPVCAVGSDTCSSYDLGGLSIPELELGETFPPDPIVPPNPIMPGSIYMTLTGLAGGFGAFAFLDPIVPQAVPGSPPIIPIAAFGPDAQIGDLSTILGPIYAFNSPGTLIGTWEVTTTVVAAPVPEPATLTLVGLGLAGAVARRFRRRR